MGRSTLVQTSAVQLYDFLVTFSSCIKKFWKLKIFWFHF
jgi:hypothetical protein